jgi:hypothetical protein
MPVDVSAAGGETGDGLLPACPSLIVTNCDGCCRSKRPASWLWATEKIVVSHRQESDSGRRPGRQRLGHGSTHLMSSKSSPQQTPPQQTPQAIHCAIHGTEPVLLPTFHICIATITLPPFEAMGTIATLSRLNSTQTGGPCRPRSR